MFRIAQLFRRYELVPGQVNGDGSGLGIPMCDALAEAGFPLNRRNNGAAAKSPKQYANVGAEDWFSAARLIEQCEVADLPDDPILIDQLCARRTKSDSKGRLAIESKDEMRQRGVASPDRADALIGCLVSSSGLGDTITQFARTSPFDMIDELDVENARGGFDAGW